MADLKHRGDRIAATGNASQPITYPKVIDKDHGRGALGRAEGKASTIKAREVGTEARATGESTAGAQEESCPSHQFGLQLSREIFHSCRDLLRKVTTLNKSSRDGRH